MIPMLSNKRETTCCLFLLDVFPSWNPAFHMSSTKPLLTEIFSASTFYTLIIVKRKEHLPSYFKYTIH